MNTILEGAALSGLVLWLLAPADPVTPYAVAIAGFCAGYRLALAVNQWVAHD